MKENLQTEVNHWRQTSYIREIRTVTERATPLVFGELLLTLRMQVFLTVGMATEEITATQLFQTLEHNTIDTTSAGDCYRFNRIAAAFESRFFDEYERVLDQMIKDQYHSGFTDPA